MPFVIPNLVIAAGLFLLSQLLTKRPKGVNPYSFNDLDLSTSRIGAGSTRVTPIIGVCVKAILTFGNFSPIMFL